MTIPDDAAARGLITGVRENSEIRRPWIPSGCNWKWMKANGTPGWFWTAAGSEAPRRFGTHEEGLDGHPGALESGVIAALCHRSPNTGGFFVPLALSGLGEIVSGLGANVSGLGTMRPGPLAQFPFPARINATVSAGLRIRAHSRLE